MKKHSTISATNTDAVGAGVGSKSAKLPWSTPSLAELRPGTERYEAARRAILAGRKPQ